MKIEKVELVNIPEIGEHRIETAKVKVIQANEIQIGELLLFGEHLLKVLEAKMITKTKDEPTEAMLFQLKSLNISTGEETVFHFPPTTIAFRILEVEFNLKSGEDWAGSQTWMRLRKPILGEMTICGACGGEVDATTIEDIQRFEEELKNPDKPCDYFRKGYLATQDCFLSYDGCEEPPRG